MDGQPIKPSANTAISIIERDVFWGGSQNSHPLQRHPSSDLRIEAVHIGHRIFMRSEKVLSISESLKFKIVCVFRVSRYFRKMPDAIITEILRTGVPGAIFLLVVFAYYRKDQELAKANKSRIDDAQAVQGQLLKNNTDCVTALRDVANAMNTQRETLGELRDTFKEFHSELRNGRNKG